MSNNRKDDLAKKGHLRGPSRLVEERGVWYFETREGTVKGPFEDRIVAMNALDAYVKVMASQFKPDTALSLMDDNEHAANQSSRARCARSLSIS